MVLKGKRKVLISKPTTVNTGVKSGKLTAKKLAHLGFISRQQFVE